MGHGEKAPKVRPRRCRHGGESHGVYALDRLLHGNIDKRLAVAKKRDRLEAELVTHCGGVENLTPPMIGLIKRAVHKWLVADQAEKAALIGEYSLGDKNYLALSNSMRLDLLALEGLLKNGKGSRLDREKWLRSVTRE